MLNKNVQKTKQLMVIFLCCLFISSCDNIPISNDLGSPKSTLYVPGLNPNNNLNTFDSVGICHNLLLDYIVENNSGFPTDSSLFRSDMKDLVTDFVNSNNYLDCDTISSDDIDLAFSNLYDNIYENSLDDIIDDFSVTQSIEIYLDSLITIVSNMVPDSSNYSYAIDVMAVINRIKSLENSVVANQTLSLVSKQQFLGAASIARHSICYWTSYIFDTNNPWHNAIFVYPSKINIMTIKSLSREEKLLTFSSPTNWHWAAQVGLVVVADVVGYFTGYSLNGTGGGVSSTVPGWIGCAVGSANAALACWADDAVNAIKAGWKWLKDNF